IRGLMVTVCPSQFATRRTLFHVLVGCGLLMLKVSRLKLPVIWLLVSMWLNTLTKSQIWTLLRSEERRVGKECSRRWSPCHAKKKSADVTVSWAAQPTSAGERAGLTHQKEMMVVL